MFSLYSQFFLKTSYHFIFVISIHVGFTITVVITKNMCNSNLLRTYVWILFGAISSVLRLCPVHIYYSVHIILKNIKKSILLFSGTALMLKWKRYFLMFLINSRSPLLLLQPGCRWCLHRFKLTFNHSWIYLLRPWIVHKVV